MRKLLVIADPHAGNVAGLAPPGYRCDRVRELQEKFYDWYKPEIKKRAPYDALLALGDLTDGEGKKGQLDTFETDVHKQAEAAALIIQEAGVDPNYIRLVAGTPFHTNGVLEYEQIVADILGCSIKPIQKFEIEGWKIHGKHVAGRSDIPYGQGTPLLKELTRLEAEAFKEGKDAPDIVLRGHVHYSMIVRKHNRIAATVPCLELPISGANSRRYSAWEYDVGFDVIYLEEGRFPEIEEVIMPIKILKEEGYECLKW